MAVGAFGLTLDRIVNVHWGGAPVVLCIFMETAPKWKLQFAHKTTDEDGEHKDYPKLTDPTYDILTDTKSANDTLISFLGTIEIDGNALVWSSPFIISFDSRGYLKIQNTHLVADPDDPRTQKTFSNVPTPDSFVYFDPSGKKIDEIPSQTTQKGTVIASDENGTWYMTMTTLDKYDEDGNKVASIDDVPDTAAFDSEAQQIRAVFSSSGPDTDFPGQGEIAFYDLEGVQQSFKIIGDEHFQGLDVSKKGKIYGLVEQGDGDTTPLVYSIEAYDTDGTKLFTIPPIGGTDFVEGGFSPAIFGALIAYGEKYLIAQFGYGPRVVTTDLHDGLFQTSTRSESYAVYDAKTGDKIFDHSFGIFTEDETILGGGSALQHNTHNISAYNQVLTIRRNDYFPRVTP